MPREKDFDQNEVVRKCTLLFAKNGYSATGIQEIVDATKINRSSLYATFKGKDELFLSCVNKAAQDEIALFTVLRKKSDGLKFLDAYFQAITKDQSFLHLFKFATAEFRMLNKKTQNYINKHYQWKFGFLLSIIKEGQKSGKITAKTDAKEMVGMIILVAQGVQNLSSLSEAEKVYKKSVRQFSTVIRKKAN